MEPPSTPFALQTSFPPVIFSYCTKTDGGRGEQRMWQIANFLKKHGIASFNGKQVEVGEDWMQKWLGKMPESDVCLAMISGPYFESGPCKEEIYKTAREKIPILPIIFETPPPLKKGFFGTSDDEREKGNFVKGELHNWLPTPDEGLFQDNWEANLAKLLVQVKKYVSADSIGPAGHGIATGVAKMTIAPAAAAGTTKMLTWADGANYVGQVKDGKPHGEGTYTWADGAKYVGQFKDDKRHGKGTFTFAIGDKYVGQFKDGLMHGEGTFTFANGAKYVGQFKDDQRHGLGKYTFADGTVAHDGEFVNGQPKK